MAVIVVTGSSGLIGSAAVEFFCQRGFHVIGIDNDMRQSLFGADASTDWNRQRLETNCAEFSHYEVDIRDESRVEAIFSEFSSDIYAIIHTAAQPSHDWAAREPKTDFSINASGTLTLLEAARQYCPRASFIFTSTNKVYGDAPNKLPLVECRTRWEIDSAHPFHQHGIDESMSIDASTHSLFGCSKLAADVMVQEYGRYFGMNTVCFRGGCLTGPCHSGTELHGFLSYLIKCAVTGEPYTVFGHKGKQVRDNIHAFDLINMFWHYCQAPRPGEVYNAGGGRHSNCSVLEAIEFCELKLNQPVNYSISEKSRVGDHIWYVSDTTKFQQHYPGWSYDYDLETIIDEILAGMSDRYASERKWQSSKLAADRPSRQPV